MPRCGAELVAFEEKQNDLLEELAEEQGVGKSKLPRTTPFCDFCILMSMLYSKVDVVPEPDDTYWKHHLKIAHGLAC
jgi:hypothetical protein